MKLEPGLHETVVTKELEKALRDASKSSQATTESLTDAGAPQMLGRYVFDALVKTLRNIPEEERGRRQVELTNDLLNIFAKKSPSAGIDAGDHVVDPATVLMAIREITEGRLSDAAIARPLVPLRHSDLLVNGPRDLSLAPAIRGELASADSVDMIVSFVKFNGVRIIRSELAAFAQRRPNVSVQRSPSGLVAAA